MRDWIRYIEENLSLERLEAPRGIRIVEELALEMEETFHEALSEGASEEEADERARGVVVDWDELARRIERSQRSHRVPGPERWLRSSEERVRQKRPSGSIIADLLHDLRFSLRTLRRNPAFLAITVMILGLGIGANTAIFSVLKTVVLQPLPYPEPDRLMTVWTPQIGYNFNPMSPPNYLDYHDRSNSFEEWGAFTERNVNLTGAETAEQVGSIWCTSGVLEALGIQPALGRFFTEDEVQPESEHVVLIGDDLWKRQFGGDPELIGRSITINGESHTVLGIMPAGYEFPGMFYSREKELWLPLILERNESERDSHWLWGIGRLKDGVTIEQARTDFSAIAASLAEEYPEANAIRIVRLVPLGQLVTGFVSGGIWVLMGAVGLVLLIACANVSSMLMARGMNRQMEVAVRASMGAGRFRLTRQLLTESLVIAAIGGSVGVVLAVWGVGIMRGIIPETVPRIASLQIDGWVLAFSSVISLLTGVIFGLVPAYSTSRIDITRTLHEGGRSHTPARRQSRFLGSLVVVQFALALVLANGAILMWRSFTKVTSTPELAEPDRVLTAGITLQGPAYEETGEWSIFWRRFLERLNNLPGIEYASVCSQRPFNYGRSGSILADGMEYDPEADQPIVAFTWVTGDYFRTIGLPLLSGRTLLEEDANEEDMNIVVNRTLAERYWPDGDPIGKHLRSNSVTPWFEATVVGVVEDVRQWGLERPANPEIFFPFTLFTWNEHWLVIRSSGDPLQLVSSIRRELATIDDDIPLSSILTGTQLYSDSSAGRRFSTLLFGLFALLALFLVAAGIYGVMSFYVAHRRHEIGVRIALGADRESVMRFVFLRALRFALLGMGIGLLGTIATAGIMGSMLYQMSPLNPVSIILVGLFLILVGLLASFIPALRAVAVDPIRALQ